jgi:hypothetical protein
MKKILTATLMSGLLASTVALAQTTAPSTNAPAPGTPAGSGSSMGGSSMGGGTMSGGSATAPMPSSAPMTTAGDMAGVKMTTGDMKAAAAMAGPVKFTSVQASDVVASRLRGADVYNANNEKLGDIEDFVVKDGRTVSGVILGVGGFLGMGERYVAVEPSSLVVYKDGDAFKVVLKASKDELNNAPKFDYSRPKS